MNAFIEALRLLQFIFNCVVLMKKQTFLLPKNIEIQLQSSQINKQNITYYSDCVFNPYVHKFVSSQILLDQHAKLVLDFSFILPAIATNPKILDNIGVLKIDKIAKYGVLITKQKEGYFLSLID